LLNALLNEERAIVSHIAGTTRDTIEDEIVIEGIGFRFIDTAGIRDTKDEVESIGIQKTFEKIENARVVVYLADATSLIKNDKRSLAIEKNVAALKQKHKDKTVLLIINKSDTLNPAEIEKLRKSHPSALFLSAKTKEGVETFKSTLLSLVNTGALGKDETIVTNTRHYHALLKALEEILKVQQGLDEGRSGDLLAVDIRQALSHFGEITGEITSDDLLGNIFANFCIGK
jgi:tRNA modification GTPase